MIFPRCFRPIRMHEPEPDSSYWACPKCKGKGYRLDRGTRYCFMPRCGYWEKVYTHQNGADPTLVPMAPDLIRKRPAHVDIVGEVPPIGRLGLRYLSSGRTTTTFQVIRLEVHEGSGMIELHKVCIGRTGYGGHPIFDPDVKPRLVSMDLPVTMVAPDSCITLMLRAIRPERVPYRARVVGFST